MIEDYMEELKNNCSKSNKGDKELLDTYQSHFLNGYIGLMFNKESSREGYEVYLYIKTKDQIASPLLYRVSNNKNELQLYYNELLNFIKNENEKNVINRCITKV